MNHQYFKYKAMNANHDLAYKTPMNEKPRLPQTPIGLSKQQSF
jgi:hypothetical protein